MKERELTNEELLEFWREEIKRPFWQGQRDTKLIRNVMEFLQDNNDV